jgi:type IV pilus assembly protein PilM
MARAVGLDIGTRVVKLVELAGTAKSFKVQRFVVREVPHPPEHAAAEGELPYDADEALAATIRDMFEGLRLPKEDICASFDAGSTVFREITVPFKDDDQIRKVVRFEAENHLHSHSIEDVVVNWIKISETRDGSRLTILASPKAELTRRLAILRRAGVEPASIDLDATALYTACDATGVFQEHPDVLVIDVGAHSTNLILVSGGRPRVLRSFLLGTDTLAATVSRDLEMPMGAGRREALSGGGQPRDDDLLVPLSALEPPAETDKGLAELRRDVVGDRRGEFIRKLERETMRSLSGLPADAPPSRILLSGGGALLPAVSEALEARFDLPVEMLDLSERAAWKDLGHDPSFAKAAAPVAIGCGLRMLGHNPLGVELLRDEFAPRNVFDVIKTALATALTLVFLTLLVLILAVRSERDAETERHIKLYRTARSIYDAAERAYMKEVKNTTDAEALDQTNRWMAGVDTELRIDQLRQRLLQRHRELEGMLGLAKNVPAIPSAPQAMYEIYKALQGVPRDEYGSWFRISKMDINERQAQVEIEVADQGVYDTVRRQLERNEYLSRRAKNPSRPVEPQSRQQIPGSGPGQWKQTFVIDFAETE